MTMNQRRFGRLQDGEANGRVLWSRRCLDTVEDVLTVTALNQDWINLLLEKVMHGPEPEPAWGRIF